MAEEKIEVEQERESKSKLHKRYEWLDQFRGYFSYYIGDYMATFRQFSRD